MVSAPARLGVDILLEASSTGEGRSPCAELLGWEPILITPGYVRVRYAARESFCNGMGNIQGGFLAAMLDDAMGPALFTLLDEGQFAPTLEIKVSFLRPATPGTIIAEGRVVHAGRSVAFLDGKLMSEDGELIATGSATARILTAVVNG